MAHSGSVEAAAAEAKQSLAPPQAGLSALRRGLEASAALVSLQTAQPNAANGHLHREAVR